MMVVFLWDKQTKGKPLHLGMQNIHSLMYMTFKPQPWNTGGADIKNVEKTMKTTWDHI